MDGRRSTRLAKLVRRDLQRRLGGWSNLCQYRPIGTTTARYVHCTLVSQSALRREHDSGGALGYDGHLPTACTRYAEQPNLNQIMA